MLKSKITGVLKTFSKEELNDFENFVQSPYFKNGRDYLPLLKILKSFHPDFDFPAPSRQFVFSKLYPKSKYNDQVMRNTLSGLMKLAEKFLVHINITRNRLEFHKTLADEFNRRKVFKQSKKNIEKCISMLNETGIDKDYFRMLYELELTQQEIFQNSNDTKGSVQCLSREGLNFVYFFILQLDSHIEEMVVFNHNLNADFINHITFKMTEYLDLEKVKRFLSENKYENSEITELYIAHINLLIDYRNEEYFKKFRELMQNNFSRLSRWGKYNMFLCLENACVRLQAVDENKYRSELVQIYREQLEQNVYNSEEGAPMAQDMFRNIVINALRLAKYDWVEEFINKYIDKLLPEHRDNMYNFSMSLLSFEKENYEQSLSYISGVKFDTFVFKFDVKILTLMVYYELGYYEAAISLIDSFRHFILETHSISGYIKEIHMNFIRYLNEIIKIKIGHKPFDKQAFMKEIRTSKVRNREWLIEKTEMIKCPG